MKRAGRSMYRKVYWLPMLAIFALMVIVIMALSPSTQRPGPALIGFLTVVSLLIAAWAFVGRIVAYWLVPLFVTTIKCPGCGEEMPTVSVWDCTCGFHDHKERNILTNRCPKCGKGAGHLDCPRCGVTILLW